MAQLDLQGVSKHFGGVQANDDISLQIERGEVVGLIGPNGSGKTTLFNSIVGFHRIDRGTVYFEGRNIAGLSPSAIARMGLIRTFQRTRIYRDMTCEENLRVSLPEQELSLWKLASTLPPASRTRAYELLSYVGLAGHERSLADELSFGQRRLVELAMALMPAPKLLLLDEPTAGINPAAIEMLFALLRQINRELGVTFLVIEHNIPVLMKLAHRICVLNRGRVLAQGTPGEVQNNQQVLDAYLGSR